MKVFVVFNFLLLLGVSLALPNNEEENGLVNAIEDGLRQAMYRPRTALKRIVRDSLMGLGQALPRLESVIIQNCKSNDETSDLQDTYDALKTCLRKKQMFATPKDEYISHIETCAADSVKKTKKCLSEDKKYFPEFLLELAKSVTNFLYDDFALLRGDVSSCLANANLYTAKLNYMRCLSRSSRENNDTDEIPSSKASFCQKFLPASYCFTNMLKDACDDTPTLQKFRKDYINSMKQPCGENEVK